MPARPATSLPAITRTYKPRSVGLALTVLTLLALASRAANATELGALLAGVEADARYAVPTRADVRIECRPECQTRRAIFLGRGDTLYVESKDGLRALVRPADALVSDGTHATAAALDARLGDTAVLLRDLAPFTAKSLALPQISDEGPDEIVVTSAPAGRSPYVLLVHTIDRARRLIVKTQYYTESIGHLGKIRRDDEFAKVGARWRPGAIRVEAFDPSRSTRLTLRWREVPDAPARLFEPGGLEHPSGLDWPAE